MPFAHVGTIEVHSSQGMIWLHCEVEGAELLIDRHAPKLFDERTQRFCDEHLHSGDDPSTGYR